MMGCFLFLAVWPGGVPCWLEKGQGACALVVWVDGGVVHAVGFPDRQAPCRGWCSVPAVLAVPLCGVGVWGGVVWWFENWRVDASMNDALLGVSGVFVLLILSNRSVPACWVGAWIVFASVLVSRPHCWCGWCLDDLISCRRVFQCRWHGPVAPFLRGWWVCCHGRMVDALAGSTDEGRVGPR